MEKTWKPVVGGICSLVGGAIAIIGGGFMGLAGMFGRGFPGMFGMYGFGMMHPWSIGGGFLDLLAIPAIILGAVAIIGGIFALRRQHWGLALAGAICAVLTPMSFILGVAAVVFVALAHGEFGK